MSNEVTNTAAPVSAAQAVSDAVSELENDTSSQEASQEAGESAQNKELSAKTAEPKKEEPKKSNRKKLKLKVDGEEFEEEIDLDDEEALRKHLQMSKVSQKRMEESALLKKELSEFFSQLKTNPRQALRELEDLGIDAKRLAAQIIEEEIADAEKSPEQKEKERMESELKALKEEREKEKEELRKREFERLQKQEFDRYQSSIGSALEGNKLPKSPYLVKKVADYMLLALNEGIEDIKPEDVVPLVKDDLHKELQEMFSVMPEEVVETLVGKETIDKIRKKQLARSKATPKTQAVSKLAADTGIANQAKDDANPKEKKTFKQYFGV